LEVNWVSKASSLLSISAGALYSQQGADAKEQGMKGTIKMDYVNIPVMANFHVADGLAFKVGIQPGFYKMSDTEYEN